MKRLRWLDRASEGEREKGKGGHTRPCGLPEDLDFYPQEGGSPGELWAEKCDLTHVLTGALWLLWEGQAVGDLGGSCGSWKEGTVLIPVSDDGGRPGRQ